MGTEWVTQDLDAWSTRDGQRVAEWMTDDCVYEDVTLGEAHTGRGEIAKFVDRMSTEFSDDFTFDLAAAVSTDELLGRVGPQGDSQRRRRAVPSHGEAVPDQGRVGGHA